MTAPAAILASSVSVRTLADGTLRLSVDIEPADAQAAFALFGKPGSAIGIARIADTAAVEHDRRQHETLSGSAASQGDDTAIGTAAVSPPAPDRKPFPLASRVALTCQSPSFIAFLATSPGYMAMAQTARYAVDRLIGSKERPEPHEIAAAFVRRFCDVGSRSEITPGSPAAERWATLEADFEHFQRTGRAA